MASYSIGEKPVTREEWEAHFYKSSVLETVPEPGFYMAMIADGGYLRFKTQNDEWTPLDMIYQCKPLKSLPKKPAYQGAFWVYFPNSKDRRERSELS